MEFLSGPALSKYLLEKYAKNPRGWNFTVAPSNKETFFDALVSGPEESWQLKIDSIFKATPLVLGAKIDEPKKPLAPQLPSYGYRKLDPAIMMKILREAAEERETNVLDKILGTLEPTAPVKGASYAEGPFVLTNQKILGISDAQRKLDERLTFGIKNLMRERYLGYG